MSRKPGVRILPAAALCLLALFGGSDAARAASPFSESGAEIAARQKIADAIQGPRAPSPRFATPRRRMSAAASKPAAPAAAPRSRTRPASPAAQTLGVNFLGANLADSNAFPPDTSGAVGPTQFLVGVNGRLRTFDKTTGTSDGGLNADTDVFFASVANGASRSCSK
jgi:hypothetical protein